MAAWIGPAIVAAVISAIVSGIGWYVSDRQAARREHARRRERVIDMQTAILAEIRAARHRLGDPRVLRAAVQENLRHDPGFVPFVPRRAPMFVLDALLSDLHLLPNEVIDPLIVYYRQVGTVALFTDDLRSERFAALVPERKGAMYDDYVNLLVYEEVLAGEAEQALRQSLSMTGEALSGRRSGGELDVVSGEQASDTPRGSTDLDRSSR